MSETYLSETALELCEECVECCLVCKTAMNFLCTYFIRNFRKIVSRAEVLHVLDELYCTTNHNVDVDNVTLSDIDVYCRVNVDKVVACEGCILERLLNAVHSILCRPLLHTLLVLEPRSAVVDSHDAAACVVHSVSLELKHLCEHGLSHSCVSAVTVNLVEGSCEIDWCIVALCSTE